MKKNINVLFYYLPLLILVAVLKYFNIWTSEVILEIIFCMYLFLFFITCILDMRRFKKLNIVAENHNEHSFNAKIIVYPSAETMAKMKAVYLKSVTKELLRCGWTDADIDAGFEINKTLCGGFQGQFWHLWHDYPFIFTKQLLQSKYKIVNENIK